MKAERRHELQTNSLAQWLWWKAPEIWQKHGSKILLGVVLVALAVVLLIRMKNRPAEERRRADFELSQAYTAIAELSQQTRFPGEAVEAEDFIAKAKEISDDPQIQARANLLLGDYYWELASFPVRPEAATRPTWRPSEPVEQLLEKAKRAYQQALIDDPNSPAQAAKAHMGIAAVAETQAFMADRAGGYKATSPHWATAREQYETVLNHPKIPRSLKDLARSKLENLERLKEPVWLVPATGPATTQTTGPTTGSILDLLQTRPATGPSTSPAATRTAR